MIEIQVKDGEEAVTLKFRRMPPEEATEWAAKLQSRLILREKLVKELELMEKVPLLERNDDQCIGLSDRAAKLQKEVQGIASGMADFIEEPGKEQVEKLMASRAGEMTEAFLDFIMQLFPSEEEVKKS